MWKHRPELKHETRQNQGRIHKQGLKQELGWRRNQSKIQDKSKEIKLKSQKQAITVSLWSVEKPTFLQGHRACMLKLACLQPIVLSGTAGPNHEWGSSRQALVQALSLGIQHYHSHKQGRMIPYVAEMTRWSVAAYGMQETRPFWLWKSLESESSMLFFSRQ